LKKLLHIIVLALAVSAFSAPVTLEDALKVAENAAKSKSLKLKHKSNYKRERKNTKDLYFAEPETPLLYVFQNGNSNGFVLVAGDDAFTPIIGISDNGVYDSLSMPDNFAWYLDNIQKEMAFALDNGQTQTPEIAREWLSFASGAVYVPGSYLVKTTWNQRAPYWNKTPIVAGGQSLTGCVATSISQIMNYHKWPKSASGAIPNYSYTINYNGNNITPNIQGIKLDTVVFDWANMNDNMVATLMNVVGRAVKMQYSPGGSGAYTSDAESALVKYFKYDATAKVEYKDYYSGNWANLMKTQVDAGLPVYYAGSDETYGGHAFVLDGYDGSGKFHINWGWSGSGDGFYALSALNPEKVTPAYKFNTGHNVIVNIKPNGVAEDYSAGFDPTVTTLDLGVADKGYNPKIKSIRFSNTDYMVLNGLNASFEKGNNSPFDVIVNIPTDMKPKASALISVRTKKDLSPGTYNDILIVKDGSELEKKLPVVFVVTAPSSGPVNYSGEFAVTGTFDLGNVNEGYNPIIKSVRFSNTGSGTLTGLTASFEKANNSPFDVIINVPTEMKPNATSLISVRTRRNLPPGYTYNDVLMVKGNNGINENLEVTFSVEEEPTSVESPVYLMLAYMPDFEAGIVFPEPYYDAEPEPATTPIATPFISTLPQNSVVKFYNLKGKPMGNSVSGLPAGVYIVKITSPGSSDVKIYRWRVL